MIPRASIICGDVFHALGYLPERRFDACFCDPPYGLEFMGRAFDRQHKLKTGANDGQRLQAWNLDWLELVYPLLKPGGRLVAASASKLYHRLACPAEDVGFTIDPLFAWINGESMAQGGNVSKLIDKAAGAERESTGASYASHRSQNQTNALAAMNRKTGTGDITAPATPLARLFHGYGTRLKDAVTPWLMAHKSPDGPWAANAAKWGTGGLNVEAGRVPTDGRPALEHTGRAGKLYGSGLEGSRAIGTTSQGRFPSNLALDDSAALEIGRQSGELRSGAMRNGERPNQRVTYAEPAGSRGESATPAGDTGDASRFFFRYQAKSGAGERRRGCENHFWRVAPGHRLGFERIDFETWRAMGHLPGCRKIRNPVPGYMGTVSPLTVNEGFTVSRSSGCAPGCQERQRYQGNIHPTLKPIELCRYLARLILPPPREDGQPRRLLIPFAGTGSEAIGALLAGWAEIVMIESEPVYCDLAAARIAAWGPYSSGRANRIVDVGGLKAETSEADQGSLW